MMRLALLSNVTVDLLAGLIGKTNDVYLSAGFDTWQQEMMVPTSGLYAYQPEAVAVLLHAGACGEIWADAAKGEEQIDEWCAAFAALCGRLPGIPVLVSSLDVTVKCRYGAQARQEAQLEDYLIQRIQELHARGASIYVLPVKDAICDLGRNAFYSPKMWYMGSMPYSMKGLAALQELIIHYASAAKGRKKKCLAVDLDNTLWGGVIGEDGVNGIVLSNNKEGARYKDTQRLLRNMRKQGVMLAILSKNNVEDVEPVFSHPDMLLQHEDFVAEAINWEAKSVSIRKLAAELNIGLDAFVFLDDNPAERERMKAECPEVAVIEFPKDSAQLPDVVAKAYEEYFLALEVTGEDARKTEMYRAESRRKAELSAAVSVDDFLKKLEMTMDIHRMRAEEEKRVVQLVNKTNQFNVTTRRYSEEQIHHMAQSSDTDIISVRMADKYGDQGLVAVLILRYDGVDAEIDSFLMSCRVMGRNAEDEIMAAVKDMLEKRGTEKVRAVYLKTAKNAPVVQLFDRLGFSLISDREEEKKYEAKTEQLPDSTGLFKEIRTAL